MLGIIVRIRDEERGNACLVRVERYEYSVQYGIETSPAGEIEKAADSAKLLGHVMVRRPSKHKHVKMTATKNPPPAVPQPPNTPRQLLEYSNSKIEYKHSKCEVGRLTLCETSTLYNVRKSP